MNTTIAEPITQPFSASIAASISAGRTSADDISPHERATLDRAELAARSLTDDPMHDRGDDPPYIDHWSLVLATIHLVHERGAVAALDTFRAALARTGHPVSADDRPHETLTVFVVWAVHRLLAAGLTPTQVLWHPLLGTEAPLAWYDRATLQSEEAHTTFVASTLALPSEPAPSLRDLRTTR